MEIKNRKKRIRTGSIVITIFLLIYVPSLLNWVSGNGIDTDIIRMGTLEDAVNTDGFFIRNEEIIKSPFEGKCITEIGEGEKIPAKFKVATVLKGSQEKLIKELKELDLKILEIQKSKNENKDIFSEDIVKIEKEIGGIIKLVMSEYRNNSLVKVGQLKDDIDKLIQKKVLIFGNSSTSDVYLQTKKAEREKLLKNMSTSKKEIISESSGTVSYMIDGYETLLSPDGIKELTPEFLDSIKVRHTNRNINNMNIETGKPFIKIVKDLEYYVVVLLEASKEKNFNINDNVVIRINEINMEIDGFICFKSNNINGKHIVAIETDKALSETVVFRKTNIDLIKCPLEGVSSYKGLKVPLGSLCKIDYKNMKAEIVLVKSNYADIRNVKIIINNNDYAIIQSLDNTEDNNINLYDTFVVKPDNIQEGQMISQ